ncbi:MAG: CBM35 domain-containing protein [Bacteroidota bacterium]
MTGNTPLPVFMLLCLLGATMCSQADLCRYEAEAGSIQHMIVNKDAGASGGTYLSIEKSSSVTWEIPVDHSGYYQLVLRYRAEGGDKMQYLTRNGSETAVGFDMSADWNLFSQPFYLDSGMNTLGIRDGWGNMDLDWIALEPPGIAYDIAPKKNTFFQNDPHDLVFKIDNFHQKVREVMLDGRSLDFSVTPYPYQESAIWLEIKASELINTASGNHELSIHLDQPVIKATISILPEPQFSGLIMVAQDIDHGASVLLKLPTGRYMLIDCGKDWVRDSIIVPMLHRHHIDTIHSMILTHYHGDHDGGDSAKTIIHDFHVQKFIDYKTYPTGYEWVQDSVHFKILNSFADGEEENTRSLAIRISYKEFVYMHGGDTYAVNQQKILDRFPSDVPAHVFHANHHFHGSVDADYIVATHPDLVILQAQEAIYARSAYMVKYKQESEKVLNSRRSSPIETLPALEVGTIVLRINNARQWGYETYRKQDNLVIQGL